MTLLRRLPLQLRLILSVAAALVLTAGLSTIPIYWHAKSKVATEMDAALVVGAQVARHEIEASRSSQDLQQRLRSLVAHFNGDRHLKAKLHNRAGAIILQSQLAPPDEAAPRWVSTFLGTQSRSTTQALPQPTTTVDRVTIEANPTNEIAEVWDDLKTFAGILALFSLLTLAFVSWIVTRAIAPVRSLLKGYKLIATGDLEARVSPNGSPELRDLCTGFNDMGDALQSMADRNEQLRRQIEEVQDEERADLARNLHDEVSPLLFAADVDAAMIEKVAKSKSLSTVNDHTAAIRDALRQLKRTVTVILGRLRPAVLLDQGLAVAVDNVIMNHARTHPDVEFNVDIKEHPGGSPDVINAAFYVIREAVANALRHGAPNNIHINVTTKQGKFLDVSVSDDGCGIAPNQTPTGFGTRNMQERVSQCHGVLTLQNNIDGSGVRVHAELPLTTDTESRR